MSTSTDHNEPRAVGEQEVAEADGDVRVLAAQVDGIARRIQQPVDCEDRATLERAADRLRTSTVELRELRGQLVTYGDRLSELATAPLPSGLEGEA